MLIAALAGCGSSRTVFTIPMEPAAPPATDAGTLSSPDAAVRGIAAIMRGELGLPMPDEVMVYVYAGRESFAEGLVKDGRVSPLRAAELSDFAIGVGRKRQLLLHDAAHGRNDREWLRLIAHELTHVSQIELAQGEGRAEQWLAEGMAEWVAFTVLERLSLDALPRRRVMATLGIQGHVALRAARLDLDTLGTPRGFTVRHLREGSLPTYQLAFLMTDYLIERHGFQRLIEYFRSLAEGLDRRASFQRSFGQDLQHFEAEVVDHLRAALRRVGGQASTRSVR
jgi:hypothetical protein